jgi:hypothetical protein
MAAAAAAAEVNALLARCGVVAAGHQNQFRNTEGVQAPEDFGVLTVNDIPELAKRMQGRHAAQRVVLGMVQIKKLQALVWWCRDRIRRGEAVGARALAAFWRRTTGQKNEKKTIQKECPGNGFLRTFAKALLTKNPSQKKARPMSEAQPIAS